MALTIEAHHVTFALCAGGCVLSALSAKKNDDLQKFFVCSNGICPAGIFTDHMRHSFNAIFIASIVLAVTFGYDALAALIRTLGYTLAFNKTFFGKLVMFLTHLSNVALGGFMLAACYANSFVFDSTYTTIQGSNINTVKLCSLAIFVLALGSALYHYALHATRAERHKPTASDGYKHLRDSRWT